MTGVVSQGSPELSFWIGKTQALEGNFVNGLLGPPFWKPPGITRLGQFDTVLYQTLFGDVNPL